jgi:hypothetical protein
MRRSVSIVLMSMVAALVQVTGAGSAVASAGGDDACVPGWHRVAPPAGDLVDVAALSPTDAWAVGSLQDRPAIEHWDGAAWTAVPSAPVTENGWLLAVTAISSSDVWAVGYTVSNMLAEHWDGTAWTASALPAPSSYLQLTDVSAVASDDVWAVGFGYGSGPLSAHWDGMQWSMVDAPGDDEGLYSVDAISHDDVWAVGGSFSGTADPIAQHWNGSAWEAVDTPPGNGYDPALLSVSAASPDDVWAVGDGTGTPTDKGTFSFAFAQHLGSSGWSSVPLPEVPVSLGRDRLSDVLAGSPDDVWTVGSLAGHAVSGHWNGSTWDMVPMFHEASSLSVDDGGQLWAIGADRSGRTHVQRLCAAPDPSADLWVVATRYDVFPNPGWFVGQREVIPFLVWNPGSLTAEEAGVTIHIPGALRFVGVGSERASCSILGRHPALIQCDVGTVQPGEQVMLNVVVDVLSHPRNDVRVRMRASSPSDPYWTNDIGDAANFVKGRSCTVIGTERGDRLRGTRRSDVICGLGGNDRIFAAPGNDALLGGPGSDVLLGGRGNDTIEGGLGWDRCRQGPGHGSTDSCSA